MMADSRAVFDWGSLPQELQDWALNYMVASRPIQLKTPHRNYFQLLVHNPPDTNKLLVSRRFNKDYSKRIEKLTNISFRDHRQCEFNVPTVPKALEKYPFSSACLLAFRHNTFSDIERHVERLREAVPQLKAKAVEIKLYCETDGEDGLNLWPASTKHDRLKDKLMEMVSIAGITRLELYWYDGSPDSQGDTEGPADDDELSEEVRKNVDEVLAGPQNLLETWTRADGWHLNSSELGSGPGPGPGSGSGSGSRLDGDDKTSSSKTIS